MKRDDVSRCLKAASENGFLGHEFPAVIFHDFRNMHERLSLLRKALPDPFRHTVAIKANPVLGVLKSVVSAGFGLEAASLEEVALARAAGCPGKGIVYNSPAKTSQDLRMAVEWGVVINVDNLQEFERLAEIAEKQAPVEPVFLRVNPLVGKGSISTTSVASSDSKFGFPVTDVPLIQNLFRDHSWLKGLHVHTGSQGYKIVDLVGGYRRVLDLKLAIDGACGQGRVSHLNIGGGLPFNYRNEDGAVIADWAKMLRLELKELFGLECVYTELGRVVHASAGWAASRVEYVKQTGDHKTAVVHLGADCFLRPVYRPNDWSHRLDVFDADFVQKKSPESEPWSIAGPLCFGEDYLARRSPMTTIAENDVIVIHDVGAYTFSMWSRHCSRGMPVILGYEEAGGPLTVLKKKETLEDIVQFWS